jgi:hypothetical protein
VEKVDNKKSELVASLIKHYEMCFEASCKFLQLYLKQKYSIDLAANLYNQKD